MAIAEHASTPPVKRSASLGTATTIITAAFSPPAGSLLVCTAVNELQNNPASQPTRTISDSAGGTWTPVLNRPGAGNGNYGQMSIWIRYLSSAATNMTVTVNRGTGGAADTVVAVRVLTGANPDQTGAAPPASGASAEIAASLLGGNITTTKPGSWVYVAAGIGGGDNPTAKPGTTTLDQWHDTANNSEILFGRLTSPTGTPGTTAVGWNRANTTAADTVWGAVEILPLDDPPVVDAGDDAVIDQFELVERTAVEAGGTGITARSWTVVSGPNQAGATLSTSAALSWAPTVGSSSTPYVLRYSATNPSGTDTDDVTVTVAPLVFPVTAPLRLSAASTGTKHVTAAVAAPLHLSATPTGAKQAAGAVDAPLRLSASATGKKINLVVAHLRLSAHLTNAGSSANAFVTARMRLSAAATDTSSTREGTDVTAPLHLAAEAAGTSTRAGDVTAALTLAATQTGAKHVPATVAAPLKLHATVGQVRHAGQAARTALLRLTASISNRSRTGGSAVTAALRLHASAVTHSTRYNQPVGPARLRLHAVVFGQRLVAEVLAITARADTTTKYELVAVARVPQVSGPPIFLEVDPVDWTDLTWTEALGESPTLSASVKIDTLTEPILQRLRTPHEMPTELWCRRNGRMVFAGPLLGGRVSGESLSLEASGLSAYLRWMHVVADLKFTDVDQFTIVATLIDQWQNQEYGHFGIDTTQVGLSGVVRTIAYPVAELHKVADRVDDFVKLADGFDMLIDPTSRQLELHSPTRGVDRSSGEDAIIFDQRNVTSSDITFSTGPADLASEGLGTGTASGSDVPLVATAANAELRARFGRTGILGSFQTDDQATLAAGVQAMVDARGKVLLIPGPTARVSLDADLSAYDVGDTIGYEAHARLSVAGAFRIRKRQVQVAETGTESVAVEFV